VDSQAKKTVLCLGTSVSQAHPPGAQAQTRETFLEAIPLGRHLDENHLQGFHEFETEDRTSIHAKADRGVVGNPTR